MRRTSHPATGVACALIALLGIVSASPSAAMAQATTTWRADGYGPTNTGYNPVETAINADTVGTLSQSWTVVSPVVRDSCSRQSPPVVANNRLFLTDQSGFAAYNATTGARLWRYVFPRPLDNGTPRLTVVGDRVIASVTYCRSVSDPSTVAYAFNASTGALLWSVSPPLHADAMVVDKDILILSGANPLYGEAVVSAYRITDGAPLWSKPQLLPRSVSANGRLLLNRYTEPGSDLVDIRTGAVLWSSPTTWTVLAAGPSGGPLFAAGPAGELVRINVETGAVVWTQPGAAAQLSTDGTRLYVAQGNQLVARDAATGAQVWTRPYASQLGKPVIAGGVVYATISGERIDPLAVATGETVDGSAPYEGAVGHPVVVNGRLYVTTGRVLDAFVLP